MRAFLQLLSPPRRPPTFPRLSRTLGEGTFGKVSWEALFLLPHSLPLFHAATFLSAPQVKFAINTETGEKVAVKILDKEKIQKQNMGAQIKKEVRGR